MKRRNFPHRKDIRRRSALERLREILEKMKGRQWARRQRRDALRYVIENTTKNLGDKQ